MSDNKKFYSREELEKFTNPQLRSLQSKHLIKVTKNTSLKSKDIINRLLKKFSTQTQIKKSSSHSSKTSFKIEIPDDLVRKIFTKKIKLEELDRYIKVIKKGLDIDKYLESDEGVLLRDLIFGIKQDIKDIYHDNFFSINYKKIMKECNITYNDSDDEIIKKLKSLKLLIIEVLKKYLFLSNNIEELNSLYHEYDSEYFDEIKKDEEEMDLFNRTYPESIYEKIDFLNEQLKNLKKSGVIVNERHIQKINDLIDEINKHPNSITKLDSSLKTYKLSNFNSRSNSSTRKNKK